MNSRRQAFVNWLKQRLEGALEEIIASSIVALFLLTVAYLTNTLPALSASPLLLYSIIAVLVVILVGSVVVLARINLGRRRMALGRERRAVRPRILQEIYGRDREMAYFQGVLQRSEAYPLCICIYGFAGVGKTALLQWISLMAKQAGLRIIGAEDDNSPYQTVARFESLAAFFKRVGQIPSDGHSPKTDYEILEEFIAQNCYGLCAILIDEFKSGDEKFKSDFEWFLGSLKSENRSALIVTASREMPRIKATLPRRFVRLDALDTESTTKFIAERWPAKAIEHSTAAIWSATGGNPQFVEYICDNDDVYERLMKGSPLQFDVLFEVWDTIKEKVPLRKALELLAVIATFTPEWSEVLAQALVPNWYDIEPDLLSKSLLETLGPNRYRLHTLLAEFIYERLSNKVNLHKIVGRYYAHRHDEYSLILALNHSIQGRDIETLKEIHAKNRDRLRFLTYSGQIESSLRAIIELVDDSDKRFRAKLLQDLGLLHLLPDDYDKAMMELTEAASIYRQIGDSIEEGWILYGMGTIHRMRAEYSQSVEILQKARAVFESISDKKGLSWALREQAEVFKYLGEYERAKQLHERARELALEIGDEIGAVNALRGIADILRFQCRFNDAIKIYQDAVVISKRLGDKMGEAYATDAIAIVYRLQGHFDTAIQHYTEALRLVESIHDRAGIANVLKGIATAHRMIGQYLKASEQYKKAEEIFFKIGHREGIVDTALGQAEISRALGELEKALTSYSRAADLANQLGLNVEKAHSALGIAEVFRLKGRPRVVEYELPFQIYQSREMTWGVVHALIGRGLARLQLQDNRGAMQDLQDAKQLCLDTFLFWELPLIENPDPQALHPLNFP